MIEQVRSYRFSIKQIFKEHWENYLSRYQDSLRQDVIWTVEKMFSCRSPEKLGYHKYACPEHPDQYIIVPHSCKTRFCNSCGKVLTDKWVERIENDFPPTGFHQQSLLLAGQSASSGSHYRRTSQCPSLQPIDSLPLSIPQPSLSPDEGFVQV